MPTHYFPLQRTLFTLLFIWIFSSAGTAQTRLTLEQAVEMALAHNKDIEIAHQNSIEADWNVKAILSRYEARSSFSSTFERARVPVNSFLSGGINGAVTQSDTIAGYRLQGFAPGGANYEVDLSLRRTVTNNIFAALNPQHASDLMLQYVQPLGRGRRFSNRMKDIAIVKKNSQLSDAQFRRIVTESVTNVKRVYWDLVLARSSMAIESEILQDMRTQLEMLQRRAAGGTAAAMNIVQFEARVADSEQKTYRASEELTRAENILKTLIVESAASDLWNAPIVPVESFDPRSQEITLDEAIAAGLRHRIEFEESDLSREINAIEQRYYRDQSRPQIDVTGVYGITALAGPLVTNPAAAPLISQLGDASIPQYMNGGLGRSLANLAENRFQTVRVGIQISLPFHNHEAEAGLGQTKAVAQRLDLQREKLKQLVQMDVRNAHAAVRSAASRRSAAAAVRVAQEQQLAGEQRKVNVGYSTADFVLERQIGLAAARMNEVREIAAYNKALVELERATGTVFETNRLVVTNR
jgi:HAE1 family hydrophobic/amphiphilic exporter-1